MVLRQRKKVEGIEKVVQELDAFPKGSKILARLG